VKAIEDVELNARENIVTIFLINVLLLGWSIDEQSQLNCMFDDKLSTIDSVCYVSSLF
jgi:hypothetical protein